MVSESGEPGAQTGLRLAGTLWRFCWLRGHYDEGRGWLEEALALGRSAEPCHRAKALTGAGVLALLQCNYGRAEARLEESLALYRRMGDRRGVASALQFLGSVARERGLYTRAEAYHVESLALWRELGNDAEGARSLNSLGFAAWLQQKYDRVAELCTEPLKMFRRLGDVQGRVWALINLGSAALYGGDLDRAETQLEESLAISRRAGYSEGVAWSLNQLGIAAYRRRDHELAEKLLRESLEVHRNLGDRWRIASVLEGLAGTACARGDLERAARLSARPRPCAKPSALPYRSANVPNATAAWTTSAPARRYGMGGGASDGRGRRRRLRVGGETGSHLGKGARRCAAGRPHPPPVGDRGTRSQRADEPPDRLGALDLRAHGRNPRQKESARSWDSVPGRNSPPG